MQHDDPELRGASVNTIGYLAEKWKSQEELFKKVLRDQYDREPIRGNRYTLKDVLKVLGDNDGGLDPDRSPSSPIDKDI